MTWVILSLHLIIRLSFVFIIIFNAFYFKRQAPLLKNLLFMNSLPSLSPCLDRPSHTAFFKLFVSTVVQNLKKLAFPCDLSWIRRISNSFGFSVKRKNPLLSQRVPFAENEGFEPPVHCCTTVFKTAAFDHSANSPRQKYTFFLFCKYFIKKK